MSYFVITTDTSSDLPQDYTEKNKIPIISLYYTIEDTTYGYRCSKNLTIRNFYDRMRSGDIPKTQQADPEQVKDIFTPILRSGLDILHIGFSSGLSGTTNSCKLAADELRAKYPERKILIVDTLAASLGEGLLVYYAIEQKKHGKSIIEIRNWLENNKLHVCHNFTVEDLGYLRKGGRISRTTAFFGTVMGIKPVLHVDNEGKLVPLSKVRGRKQSLTQLVENMEKQIGSYRNKNEIFFISHGDSLDDAKEVECMVKERLGIKQCMVNNVGPAIGAHSGPGTIALFFLGEQR